MTPIRGRIWVLGDDVNTDVIHPPEFYSLDSGRVKSGLFRGYDPTLQSRLQPGDILVAGHNFGCGSSRETSIQALKLNEVGAIVALDFARIFFRNATNNGLPVLTFADPSDLARLKEGQTVELFAAEARMTVEDVGEIRLEPPGDFVVRIWEAGGLLALLPEAHAGPEGRRR